MNFSFRVLSLSAPLAVAAALNFRSPAEVAQGCGCRWLTQPCGYAAAAAASAAPPVVSADAVDTADTEDTADTADIADTEAGAPLPQKANGSTFRQLSRRPAMRRLVAVAIGGNTRSFSYAPAYSICDYPCKTKQGDMKMTLPFMTRSPASSSTRSGSGSRRSTRRASRR